ncbi:metal-dependent amidase/aminoacylase/carboxypeptidase [Dothidotthia symphoricarpi CBS 119687]|uniref:Metal-dependent amidase/aminoacylase/carboxypeptidase n=1 Tax=Dothidotthia symphoricarpi CBS 119687 TaxID=1392245 RepID=A0A6A6AMY5_9PLEO|nr:metal-dependent amidase/aminoacylase/carboxypeptidase [Dothidotthia symphoricarpi CBS 119687]KAF2132247.1 metal-dependent amidase/aminoacylase/carboxypeptidase [Dothidotthia symphoricarpi CBS 119687]
MPSISETVSNRRVGLGPYEELYKYFHAHPELSFQEKATAEAIVSHLGTLNAYTIHSSIGGHGVAAVLKNGPGKTVLLRADIDALPVEERTGLAYTSKARMKDLEGHEKPVMHACGHDMHITALLAAGETLANVRDAWSGTVILCFQPAEEKAGGAQSMVDGGLYDKVPLPDVVVGAHVVPEKSGVIGTKRGLIASSADSFQLRIEGRQAHASTPHRGIDPIVQAASTIMRLQTIVSREVDPLDFAVVTVSAIHAGDAENIIPESADLKINVRAALPDTRTRILTSMEKIIAAEAQASSNPSQPSLTQTTRFPLLFNDDDVTSALEKSFSQHFEVGKHGYSSNVPRLQGSEDFGILATAIGKPSCFFLYGGIDPEVYERAESEGKLKEMPGNHSPFFAPVLQPTLTVGVDGYVVAALTFLGKEM